MRILIAGLIGGIVMFIWGSVVHTLLPIGEMGLHVPTDQPAALSALAQTTKAGEGIYMYPSVGPETMNDKAAMAAFVAATRTARSRSSSINPVAIRSSAAWRRTWPSNWSATSLRDL